jgi:hypothetical protein
MNNIIENIYNIWSNVIYIVTSKNIYIERYKREVIEGFTKAALLTRSRIQAKLVSVYF